MTRGLPEEGGALAAQASEPLLEALRDFDAAVAGPGLGTGKGTVALLEKLLSARCPLVCDADALNAFAGRPRAFSRRRGPTVLTPHPGEAARLLETAGKDVQRDRLAAARRLARSSRAVVLLKERQPDVPAVGERDSQSDRDSADVHGRIGRRARRRDRRLSRRRIEGGAGRDRRRLPARLRGRAARGELGDAGLLAGELARSCRARARPCGASRRREGRRWETIEGRTR